MRAVAICLLLVASVHAFRQGALGPDEELTLFDTKGGHNDAGQLRECYDTMRRVSGCPISKRTLARNGQTITLVGTTAKPLECTASEVDGTLMMKITYMLLRTMSKSSFVKNAYFTGPVGGKKPTHQHFSDVFLGQLVFNVLNAADRSAVEKLPEPAKSSYLALTQPNTMWASVKFGTFQGKKERIAMDSTEFRRHIKNIRETPASQFPLHGTCRRVKYVLASMDVGADVAKYALDKKFAIAKLINKIVTTVLKIGAGVLPVGGAAVSALVGIVSDLVDSAIDSSKDKVARKYAIQDVILQLLSGFIAAKQETPPVEAMVTANTAQGAEIIAVLKTIQAKMAIKPRPRKSRPRRRRFVSSRFPVSANFGTGVEDAEDVERYSFQQISPSFLELKGDEFAVTEYATGEECNKQVQALLYVVENMLEDVPNNGAAQSDGIETDVYRKINFCGPNPSIMGEKENVLRCKAIFKLIKYFVTVPDASGVEAESWLSKVNAKATMVIDTAADLYDQFGTESSSTEGTE